MRMVKKKKKTFVRQCRHTSWWEALPLIQCNNLLNISQGQFHALFPRLLGHPQKNFSLQRLYRMMMRVLKWCKRVSLPQALFPIAHAEIQSYVLNANPNEPCIISCIWSLALQQRQIGILCFPGYHNKNVEREDSTADLSKCVYACVFVP